jgi:hypothetical protein
MDWIMHGRPRAGPIFFIHEKTHAAFKLALRYCKQHEEHMRAAAYAVSLSECHFTTLWSLVNKVNNATVTNMLTLSVVQLVKLKYLKCGLIISISCTILLLMMELKMCSVTG